MIFFPLKIYSAITKDFVNICLAKGRSNIAVADHCCWCTSNEQSSKKTRNCGYRLICEPLNCRMFNYVFWLAMAPFTSVSIQDSVESVPCGRLRNNVCSWNSKLWAQMLEYGTRFIFLNEPFLYIYFWPTNWISLIKTIIIPLTLRGHDTFGLEQYYNKHTVLCIHIRLKYIIPNRTKRNQRIIYIQKLPRK